MNAGDCHDAAEAIRATVARLDDIFDEFGYAAEAEPVILEQMDHLRRLADQIDPVATSSR